MSEKFKKPKNYTDESRNEKSREIIDTCERMSGNEFTCSCSYEIS